MNKLELAIQDFQFILEVEPNNTEANRDLKAARKTLNTKLSSTTSQAKEPTSQSEPKQETKREPVVEQKKETNKFVRVAIEEDNDEEEQT